MSPILTVVLVLVAAAVAGALGFYLGGENRKRTAEAKIGSAEEEAKRIVNDAIKAAEQKRKETIIEAKDEAFKLKSDADKEIKDRRAESPPGAPHRPEGGGPRQAHRPDGAKGGGPQAPAVRPWRPAWTSWSSSSCARPKSWKPSPPCPRRTPAPSCSNRSTDELTHEKAMKISAYQANMKDECDNLARELIGQAIARCAADATSEATVSVVPLPSDEMKGRIIGREGRNIRALETATGM